MDDLIGKKQKYSDNKKDSFDCEESHCFDENMRRKNCDQSGDSGDSPQQKQLRFEDIEKLLENMRKIEAENHSLKKDLDSTQAKEKELVAKINALEKELDEFKRINTIQENCIENSESEILRLNECLKVTELMLQETVEVSEEIISDLKSKLKSANESVPKSPTTTDISVAEVKGQDIKRQKSKTSFYLELNRNSSQNSTDFKTKRELKVLRHQMSDDLRHLVIQIIRQLSQTVDSLDQLPDLLTKRLNKTLGKIWFCVIGENITENSSLNSTNKYYLKCELGQKYQIIVFKYFSEFSPNTSVENSQENSNNQAGGDQLVRIVRKSHNIEAQVEKFIVNNAKEALNRRLDDYHTLSSYIRDVICNKYSSQWFVSVGQTQHYCTSWALARSRKFMLFEIGEIKFTIGEVAGWLW